MGRCKFRNNWLSLKDNSGYKISLWAEKFSDFELFCKLCTCVVNVSNKGFHAVVQHSEGLKHKKRCRDILGGKQLMLTTVLPDSDDVIRVQSSSTSVVATKQSNSLPTVGLFSARDKATIAELIWTMKSISSNYSANSCTDLKVTFEYMFPGALPDGFSLCPQKMHYLITDALGVYFHDEMLEDVGSSPYSICYDETTNAKDQKELQLTISYWSDLKNQIVKRHFETIFTGKADAITLHTLISKSISNANLSLRNLQMIGSDGPNVNIKVLKLFNEELIGIRSKGLVDIGTCPLHIVHNAFLKSMQAFGEDSMTLVISVYHYFNGWPSRWEEYENVQKELNLPPHRFLKHTSTRWLSYIASGERLIEQWAGLEKYFLKYLPSKKRNDVLQKQSLRKITDLLKKPEMLAQVHFTLSSAKLFQKFTQRFQSEAPLIHILYEELLEITETIAGRVCKGTAVTDTKSSAYEWKSSKLFESENLLPLRQVVLSETVKRELSRLQEIEALSFFKNVQAHYISGAKHLVEKAMTPSVDLKKALGFLNPRWRKSEKSCRYMRKVATALSLNIPNEDQLVDEWKSLQLVKEPDISESKTTPNRIDDYWAYFMGLKRVDGSSKFSFINKVIKAALCLSHGNADIERRFSVSKRALTEEKTQMSCRTLNSILIIKDAIRLYNNKPHLVPITKKMINLGQNAHKHYQNFLEEQRLAQEKEAKLREEEINLKKAEEEKFENAKIAKRSITEIERNLSEKKRKYSDTKESADSLLSEARDRLRKALKKGDLKEAQVVQGMLEGVMALKEEEDKEQKDIQTLQNTAQRKRDALITSFFKAPLKKK